MILSHLFTTFTSFHKFLQQATSKGKTGKVKVDAIVWFFKSILLFDTFAHIDNCYPLIPNIQELSCQLPRFHQIRPESLNNLILSQKVFYWDQDRRLMGKALLLIICPTQ